MAEGDLLWTNSDISDAMSVVVSTDGYIYACDYNGKVIKVDSDGNTLDSFQIPGGYTYYNNIALSPDENTLYVCDEDTYLYAVNVVDMTEKWKVPVSYVENGLIVDKDGYIYYIDLYDVVKIDWDGTPKWRTASPDWPESPLAITKDNAVIGHVFVDSYLYAEFLDTNDGSLIGTNYEGDYIDFGESSRPFITFDDNNDLIIVSGGYNLDKEIIKCTIYGVTTEGGNEYAESFYSGIVFDSSNNIVVCRVEPASRPIASFSPSLVENWETSRTDIFGFDANTYCACQPNIDDNGYTYLVLSHGNPIHGTPYGGHLAIDSLDGSVVWYHETTDSGYGMTSIALMRDPVKMVLMGGSLGLYAYEITGVPLHDRDDYYNGKIGLSLGVQGNQRIIYIPPVVEPAVVESLNGIPDSLTFGYRRKRRFKTEV